LKKAVKLATSVCLLHQNSSSSKIYGCVPDDHDINLFPGMCTWKNQKNYSCTKSSRWKQTDTCKFCWMYKQNGETTFTALTTWQISWNTLYKTNNDIRVQK